MAASGRREVILEAARGAFTVRGYDGTSVADIARELGVSKAAINYYFPAKSDLAEALLAEFAATLEAILGESDAYEWPDEVRRVLRNYLRALLRDQDLACWVDTDPALRADGHLGTKVKSLDRRLARRIAGPGGRQRDLMRAFAVIGGIWRPLHHESSTDIETHLEEIVEAAMVSYAPTEVD